MELAAATRVAGGKLWSLLIVMRKQVVLMGVLLMAGGAFSQTREHRRPGADDASTPSASLAKSATVRQALPEAAEGEYRWRETGEVIELYVEDQALHGYLTRRSEQHGTGSAPMTFEFLQSDTAGGRLQFTTSHVHGEWYSFSGHVARGPAASPNQEGYYLLQGVLETHGENAPLSREVSLKRSGSTR